MGAEFLEVPLEEDGEGGGGYAKEMSRPSSRPRWPSSRKQAKEVDMVITTALIPGKPAPVLWLRDMVESDAAGLGGRRPRRGDGRQLRADRARPGHQHHGVMIIGRTDLTSRLATTASQLYGNEPRPPLNDMGGGKLAVDLDDEVVRGASSPTRAR
jgi:NAD/NADP transhydrogenase alpha subunit